MYQLRAKVEYQPSCDEGALFNSGNDDMPPIGCPSPVLAVPFQYNLLNFIFYILTTKIKTDQQR